jgi:hypothetical protein
LGVGNVHAYIHWICISAPAPAPAPTPFGLRSLTAASARTRSRARERVALARLAEQLRALVIAAHKLPLPQVESTAPPSHSPAGASPKKASKKKKKKKRTTLANEGNPHHVDKCT